MADQKVTPGKGKGKGKAPGQGKAKGDDAPLDLSDVPQLIVKLKKQIDVYKRQPPVSTSTAPPAAS